MLWRPAQFVAQLRRIDGVPQVVADAVDNVVEVVGIAAHQLEQRAQHREVVALAVGADQIGLPGLTAVQDAPDRVVVVARRGSSRGRWRPSPYSFGRRPVSTLVIWRGMNFSTC